MNLILIGNKCKYLVLSKSITIDIFHFPRSLYNIKYVIRHAVVLSQR